MDIRYQHGLHLPDLDLWLDPHQSRPAAVISHAHSDHARRHRQTYTTEPTRLLLAHRRTLGPCVTSLPFGQPVPVADGLLTLLPAGHILGSAQVLVEHGGHRLLYTGDFKPRAGLAAEPLESVRADTLVMESTFGRPHYRFPPAADTLAQIEAFCRTALALSETPVIIAYALGKAQELLLALAMSGLPLCVHPSVDTINQIYRRCGVALPEYTTLSASCGAGQVLICPPQARTSAALTAIERKRTAFVSGWAMDRGACYRFRCDAVFPLSDHADYAELLDYAERVAPSRIYTVHGFAHELAAALRDRGHAAYSLTAPDQLRLF